MTAKKKPKKLTKKLYLETVRKSMKDFVKHGQLYGWTSPHEPVCDTDEPLDPKRVPVMRGLEQFLEEWKVPENKLEKDLAYLQVCVEALNERVNMLEAENARLRAMWGGCNSQGEPYWLAFKAPVVGLGSITTGRDTITA